MANRFFWLIVVTVLVLSGSFGFLYINGYFANYSAGVTSCTTFKDALSSQTSEYCSALVPLPLTGSVTALTPSGKNFTFYDSSTGKSAPVVRDARLTLSPQTVIATGYSVSSTCTAVVDGKQVATNSSSGLFSSLKATRICVLSIDGRALQSYFSNNMSMHTVQYSVSGKATAFFPTGSSSSVAFRGSLGNINISITNPGMAGIAGAKEIVGYGTISLPSIGSSAAQNAVITRSSVAPVSATLTSSTTGTLNPDYAKQVDNTIVTSSANAPMQIQVGSSTITVNACDVGSCSYNPPTAASSQATVTAVVSKNDITAYQHDSQQVLDQFGAKSVNDLTPYSKCAYCKQGC